MKDPARAVLQHVLLLTLEHGRFPREEWARRKLRGKDDVFDRLLADRRYLARALVAEDARSYPPRLAVTIRGLYVIDHKRSRAEEHGLARTHDRLAKAVREGLFRSAPELIEVHKAIGAGIELVDFRRWCTLLCSPRLQGRYDFDPIGFCGRTDAAARADVNTGFFEQLLIHPTFLDWPGLPDRDSPRAFLLSEDGLRVETDKHRQVHVQFGTAEIRVLSDSMPAHVFAALVEHPGQPMHSLDLQAHGHGCASVSALYEFDAESAAERLRDLGIPADLETWESPDVDRLAAALRRVDLLESLADRDGQLPKFAQDPKARREAVLAELRAALADGPLRAELPLVKNATRSVSRGLTELLEDEELASFREHFKLGEWIEYRKTT